MKNINRFTGREALKFYQQPLTVLAVVSQVGQQAGRSLLMTVVHWLMKNAKPKTTWDNSF